MKRAWVVIVGLAVASLAVLGRWWATPTLPVSCRGSERPPALRVTGTLRYGHAVATVGFDLHDDAITIQSPDGTTRTHPLAVGEFEGLRRRLTTPRPLPRFFGSSTTQLSAELRCPEGTRTAEYHTSFGSTHPTFDTLRRSPSPSMALEWLEGVVDDLDPRARRVTELGVELIALEYPSVYDL